MPLCLEAFIRISDDKATGILTRDKALEIIKANTLEKVELTSFNYAGDVCFTLSLKHTWAWHTDLIRRELSRFHIPLVREDLEFYASTVDSYPLFVLKKGWDKAVCVSPTEFREAET
jgi:hypothetical protein